MILSRRRCVQLRGSSAVFFGVVMLGSLVTTSDSVVDGPPPPHVSTHALPPTLGDLVQTQHSLAELTKKTHRGLGKLRENLEKPVARRAARCEHVQHVNNSVVACRKRPSFGPQLLSAVRCSQVWTLCVCRSRLENKARFTCTY